MMKSIDKKVQDSMNQLDHPYSSAYWYNALSHIKNREKRRRRLIGFWWIMAGMIIISAVSWIWLTSSGNKEKLHNSSTRDVAGPGQSELPFDREKNIETIENGSDHNEKAIAANGNFIGAQISQSPSKSGMKASGDRQDNDLIGENSLDNAALTEKKLAVPDEDEESTEQIIGQGQEMLSPEFVGELNQEGQIAFIPGLPLNPIEREFIWLIELPVFEPDIAIQPILWNLNILTELSVLTNVPGRSKEKAILGGQAAVGARWTASNGFFTGISGGYAMRTGTFGNMLDHPTPEYVFEKKEEGFRLIPTTLSYAISQIYTGWERGKWSGRIGLQPMYLIGATGVLHQYSTEVSAEDPGVIISRVSKVSEGLISAPSFRNWAFELQAGLEFNISERWRVIGQFAYTPGGLTYPLVEHKYDPIEGRYDSIAGESVLKEQFLHIQLGIQYKW